jgi:hypothetical protein
MIRNTPIPKKQRITHQSAKSKGRTLQQWVCQRIADLTGFAWGMDEPISSRPMGQCGTDVRMEAGVLKKFPFSVECKWQESWGVPGWIEQARTNQVKGTDWLLVCKRSRKPPVIVMDAARFFEIYAQLKK